MKAKTTESFIAQASAIHGSRYNYGETVYKAGRERVIVICPQHGAWSPIADNHIRHKSGCPKCAGNQAAGLEGFIKKARTKHKGRYDYSEVIYTDSLTKVEILCPVHGKFEQRPDAHVRGQGCPTCAQLRE